MTMKRTPFRILSPWSKLGRSSSQSSQLATATTLNATGACRPAATRQRVSAGWAPISYANTAALASSGAADFLLVISIVKIIVL